LTEREHTGKKIVDCQIIGPAAAGSAGYVASPMLKQYFATNIMQIYQMKKRMSVISIEIFL